MIIHIDAWLGELKRLHAEFNEACRKNETLSIERSLYYSALVMRKLSETPFVTREFESKSMDVNFYEPAIDFIDGLKWLEAEAHFNFNSGEPRRISFSDVCNVLIHSQFLDWRPGSGQVKEILVAGGIRARAEAIGFAPQEYTSLLTYVENYEYKKFPLRSARRT